MSKIHIVKQGEHLSSIAEENGFANFHTIFDHPNNAQFKANRDPHVLFPGDKIFIPDRKAKSTNVATTKVHVFKLLSSRLFLRVRVLDVHARPIGGASCDLGLEAGKPLVKNTDKTGLVVPEEEIEKKIRDGELTVHVKTPPAKKTDPPPPVTDVKFDLKIGDLNPETKLSGQRARLNNLGYFAGYELDDLEQFLWAAEEFECDRINHSQARVTARPTLIAVPKDDQKDGQELGDPAKKTGVQEQKLRGEMKKAHGC